MLPDGRVRLTLKTPYSDGTTHLVLSPQELLEKLVALIPRPRVNLLIYSGVLAPHAKLRKAVVAYGREPAKQADGTAAGPTVGEILARVQTEAQPASYLLALEQQPPAPPNYTWAQLMQRAYEIDVLECDKCGGRLRFIACVTKPEAITAILKHLGLPDTPPAIAPARSPPEPECGEMLFDEVV